MNPGQPTPGSAAPSPISDAQGLTPEPDAAAQPGAGGAGWRVILVGRTGLDARLRLDPGLELIRVRSALEAIGELADPLEDHPAGRCVVIVASEADPGRPEAPPWEGQARDGPGRVQEFVTALRTVDPRVRVLRVAETGAGSGSAAPYDAWAPADLTAEGLRQLLGLSAPEDLRGVRLGDAGAGSGTGAGVGSGADAGAHSGADPDSGVGADAAAEQGAHPTIEFADDVGPLVEAMLDRPRGVPGAGGERRGEETFGDESLLRALLAGREILETALEQIRRRVGARDVQFEPAADPGAPRRDPQAEPLGAGSAVVAWRDRLLGFLRSPGADRAALARAADWLAAWLTLRDQQFQLRQAALTDPLTGAYNRRFFEHFLESAIRQARAARQSVTVLVFDIDDFKSFNDRHGHAAGDEILRETVRLLASVIRPCDRVCRIGGDEFAVVFYEPAGPRHPASRPPEDVFQIARRFQRQVAQQRFPKLGRSAPGTLTISGGLATYPWDGSSAAELLARADELAMQTKRSGKNAITFGPGAPVVDDA